MTDAPATAELQGAAKFPWILVVVNVLALVVGAFVNVSPNPCGLVGCTFLLCLFTAFQAALWPWFSRSSSKRFVGKSLSLLPAILFTYSAIMSLPTFEVPNTLRKLNFAPLPASAQSLRSYHWSSGFAYEEFISFQADPQEIETFLKNSSAILGRRPKNYTSAHQRVASNPTQLVDPDRFEIFVPRSGAPKWWDEEIRVRGRLFQFHAGYLIYNEDARTIYLCTGG